MGDKLTSSSSSSLAPGFRFHPTDEELVIYYLKRKVCGRPFRVDAISDIDIYKFEPWDLPDRSRLKSRDLEWYFFSGLDKKYGNGWRTNRATDQGYWKTTGKDRSVSRAGKVVGMKKTLVFHIGRAPHGERTNWVMHEYRLVVDDQLTQAGIAQDAFVLCRVFRKSGPGPKNGEKYGAPFVEEEWEDWEDNVVSLKNEVANDGYYGLPEDEPQHYLQYHDQVKEERAVAIIPEPNIVAGNGSDHLENSGTLSGEGQNVYVSTGENDGVVESPDENAFILPEQFEMDQPINENEFFTLDDFLNPAYDGSYTDDPVDGEFTFSDALQDHPVVDGPLLAFDGSNSSGVDQNADQKFDECLNYFDAIDDSNIVGFGSSQVSDGGVPFWDESVFTEEDKQTGMPLPESPETYGNEGASSSAKQPEISKIAGDVKYNQGWDSNLAKQVSRMLGSFPAPSAYAAEMPTKGVAFGQNSAPHASTSVHVTAGMIHISGMAVFGGEKIWSMGKSGDHLVLPYSMTLANLSIQPMGNTLSSKATGVIMRSAFYFMFFWVLVLSLSCKIGSFIYNRQFL